MSVEGIRVVRGPNWSYGNDDGGEGHVGTVTQDNQDDTLEVQWDMGKNGTYNSGKDGKCDLRILDSSPSGIQHAGVDCDACKIKSFTGTRWKCSKCNNYDLCTPCYFGDKHEITHPFIRIDAPGLKGESVPKRSASVRQSALGMFKNAEVRRGADWNSGNQDGGSGEIGIVQEVRSYTKDGGVNNAVSVRWKNDQTNTYRLGYRGKVDLECVEETSGISYYRDHLFPLSTVKIREKQKPPTVNVQHRQQTEETTGSDWVPPLPPRPRARVVPSFKVGDKVCIELPETDLKEKQRGHGGWSLRMKECIGQHGVVQKIEENGDCVIDYEGKKYRFNSEAIRKVPSLKFGDKVRILNDAAKVQVLQKRHGGWQQEMSAQLGKVGKVIKIDSDGDVAVGFGNKAWVFNPACCEPAPDAKLSDEGKDRPGSSEGRERKPEGATGGHGRNDGGDDDDDDGRDEAAEALGRLVAQMFLLRGARSAIGPQQFIQAAADNSVKTVKDILARDKKLIDQKFKGLTALIISSHEGHQEVVKILVENGANLNLTEEKGNTALMAALMKKREQVAIYLMEKGADIHKVNVMGRNALHCAALNGASSSLRMLLEKGSDVNRQDGAGDTPLHDAIAAKENTCVAFLLTASKINLLVCNKKGFSPLHFAALKDDDVSIEKILAKAPQMKNTTILEGNSALHIAAINDNISSVKTLLKAGVNVNATTGKKYTPLHLACHKGFVKTVEVLVSSSADVTAVDEDGDTPLHNCMMGSRQKQDPLQLLMGLRVTNQGEISDRHQIACLLIKSGASVRVRNNKGNTPLEVCSFEKLTNAVKLFAAKHEQARGGSGRSSAGSGRGQGRVTLADLLLDLPIPCMACMESMADARFIPCRHKVCCQQCAFRTRQCPACHQPISYREDLQGRRLVMTDPCKVQ